MSRECKDSLTASIACWRIPHPLTGTPDTEWEMKTPAGQECKFYYEDFHRGRSKQECRLLRDASHTLAWQPSDCERCPTLRILRDNASPHLVLEGRIRPGFLGLGRRVEVTAYCSKHNQKLEDPHIGCPICADELPNPLKELFK